MRLVTAVALVLAFGLVAGQTTTQAPTQSTTRATTTQKTTPQTTTRATTTQKTTPKTTTTLRTTTVKASTSSRKISTNPTSSTTPRPPYTGTTPRADGHCGMNKYQIQSKSFLPQPFIVGGGDAEPHAYPWQVSLMKYGSHICGGSIIGKRIILTAAHCFSSTYASNYGILVGKQVMYLTEPHQRTYHVEVIRLHSQYNSYTHENDIAIVKVDRDIDYNEDVKPVCLPPSYLGDLVGETGTVTGWGAIYEGGSTYSTLQVVGLPIISNDKCQTQYAGRGTIFETNLCAGFDLGGKDSCQGDSGGPMVVYDPNGVALQVGVVSWGRGCGRANYAGINTRVSKYIDWIRENDASSAHMSKVTVLSACILAITYIFTAI